MKAKIIGAKEGACEMCGGIIYTFKNSLGIMCQCKQCGNTYMKKGE